MSSGHRKGGEENPVAIQRYRLALKDSCFQQWLKRQIRVSYQYEIPYLAGYSKDGHTIYIDRDFPSQRGYPELVPGLVTHELWEKTAIDCWRLDYLPAHELAIVAENIVVRSVLKMDPRKYNAILKPAIKSDEIDPKQVPLPPDLDMTPYVGSKWYHGPIPRH